MKLCPFLMVKTNTPLVHKGEILHINVNPCTHGNLVQPRVDVLTGFPFAPQTEKRHETEGQNRHDGEDSSRQTQVCSHTWKTEERGGTSERSHSCSASTNVYWSLVSNMWWRRQPPLTGSGLQKHNRNAASMLWHLRELGTCISEYLDSELLQGTLNNPMLFLF